MDKQKITPLVIKAQKGDKNALQELFTSCYDSLYYFAYKTTKSEDLAADITQDSCIEIMKSIDKLKDPNAFSTWAHQITYHQCTRYFRETKEVLLEENEDGETILDILPDESDDALPEQVVEDKEFQNILQNMLNELPSEQRSAMLLYYYENLSVKEIAKIHGTTEGTVKSRLNYGRKAVKQQVESYEKKTGVKLHSIAPLPLLLYFLFKQGKESASSAAASAMPAITSAVTSALNSAVASSAAGVGVVAAKAAGASVTAKIIASSAAVVFVATAAVGTVHVVNNSSEDKDTSSSGIVTENQIDDGWLNEEIGHAHQYTYWEYDNDNHWQVCECGDKTVSESHSSDGGNCTVCGKKTESVGLKFEIRDDYAVLVDIGGNRDSEVVIPREYEGKPVREIGEKVFTNWNHVKNVIIPDSVTTIGNNAFFRCYGLVNVTIPDSVTEIGEYAFDSCQNLESISLPDSITTIGKSAFSDCNKLKSVSVPNGVTRIEFSTFSRCENLSEIILPESITFIDYSAFDSCEVLEKINIPDSVVVMNCNFYGCTKLRESDNGVIYVENIAVGAEKGVTDVTLRNGTRHIAGTAFDSNQEIVSIVIPDTVIGIGYQAFYRCSHLTSITIPDSVTSIGMRAFESCSMLENITLPNSITSIGDYAFKDCYNLKTITFDGTQAQWDAIEKSEDKFNNFTNAEIVFAK